VFDRAFWITWSAYNALRLLTIISTTHSNNYYSLILLGKLNSLYCFFSDSLLKLWPVEPSLICYVIMNFYFYELCFTCKRLVLSASGSALTLHATSNWAVELATCLAEETSFSSELTPCTRELADSTRLCVAAATSRAAEISPSDHCPSSDDVKGLRLTYESSEQ